MLTQSEGLNFYFEVAMNSSHILKMIYSPVFM